MNCQDAIRNLEAWDLKTLQVEHELKISQHLLDCPNCRLELARLEQIKSFLPRSFVSEAPTAGNQRHLKLALACSLFFLAIWIGGQIPHSTSVENVGIKKSDRRDAVVRQSPGAEYTFLNSGLLELRSGELELFIAQGDLPFEVATPLGRILTSHAQFTVSLEKEEMDAKTLTGAAGILTVGVAIGSVLFGNNDGATTEIGAGQEIRREAGPAEPMVEKAVIPRRYANESLNDVQAEADAKRIAELEQQVRSLKSTQATERATLKKMREAIAASNAKQDDRLQNGIDVEGERKKVGPRELAESLGLGSAREEALVQAYEKFQEKIREQEKRHAKVEETEDGYKIEIPEWPEDWKNLEKDWHRDLSGILMPKELKQYQSQGLGNQLFRDQGGNSTRSIVISPTQGGYMTEETRKGNGMMMKMVDDGHPSLDAALGNLSHLIDK